MLLSSKHPIASICWGRRPRSMMGSGLDPEPRSITWAFGEGALRLVRSDGAMFNCAMFVAAAAFIGGAVVLSTRDLERAA